MVVISPGAGRVECSRMVRGWCWNDFGMVWYVRGMVLGLFGTGLGVAGRLFGGQGWAKEAS